MKPYKVNMKRIRRRQEMRAIVNALPIIIINIVIIIAIYLITFKLIDAGL